MQIEFIGHGLNTDNKLNVGDQLATPLSEVLLENVGLLCEVSRLRHTSRATNTNPQLAQVSHENASFVSMTSLRIIGILKNDISSYAAKSFQLASQSQ